MSVDDRFEEIKRLLDSTISEFKSLFESAGGFEDSRVGNGWDPSTLKVDMYYLTPKPIDELSRLAVSRKRTLFQNRLLTFLRPPEGEVKLLGDYRVRLVPFWRIKGFHECFYFRGNSYKIDLPGDVVAVEVEGRIRDLVGQDGGELMRLASLPRRLLGMKSISAMKSIRLSDVTELAYRFEEGAIFADAEGKEDLEAEAFFESKIPLEKTSQQELPDVFQSFEIASTAVSREELVRRLHTMVVKPPAAFSKILSNRFQVTELAEFLIPVYSFTFVCNGRQKSIGLHGYTGGVYS